MRPLSVHAFVSRRQTLETIQACLNEAGWPSVVEMGDVSLALETAHRWIAIPDVIILDVSDEVDQLRAIRAFADNAPPGEADIVIIGNGNDIKTFRAFKELGAFEYIPAPVEKSDVEATFSLLKRAAATRKNLPDPGKLISVVSTRGGAGGSTIAAELARGIATKHGKKVLLIDLDLETGCQHSILNVDATPGFDLMLDNPTAVDSLLLARTVAKTHDKNLLLLSDVMQDTHDRFRPGAAADLITAIAKNADYIVVDIPARSPFLRDVALISQTLIAVTIPVFNGLRDTVALLDRIEKWNVGAIKNTFVLVNRHGELKTSVVTPQAFKEEAAKGGKVDFRDGISIIPLPYAPKVAVRSAHTGEAIASDPSPLGKAIVSLTALMPSAPQKTQNKSFISTLFGTRT